MLLSNGAAPLSTHSTRQDEPPLHVPSEAGEVTKIVACVDSAKEKSTKRAMQTVETTGDILSLSCAVVGILETELEPDGRLRWSRVGEGS